MNDEVVSRSEATMTIIEQLAAVVEAARAEKCRDSVRGDTCGACGYCLAWALTDDWEQQLRAVEGGRDEARALYVEAEEKFSREASRVAVLTGALDGLLNIINESNGVVGFHRNDDVATWDEFEEVDAAAAALTPKAEA